MSIRALVPLLITSVVATIAAGAPGAVAQPTPGPGPVATAKAAEQQTYVLGPADVIEVSVLGRADFTTRTRIEEDGTVQLPFLGRVPAGGYTAADLGNRLGKDLEKGGYYQHPIVSVAIVSYASRYVTVLGDFSSPGLVPVDRPYRVSEILARVGGTRGNAANYIVFVPQHGPEQRLLITTLATGNGKDDPFVSPGDKLYSPDADQFYISGQVKGPGSYPLTEHLTLRMALSRSGGLTELGSDHRIKITRGDKTLTKVDLDSEIQKGDVIVVGERLF